MFSFLLRDHAKEILQSIVKDISEPQSSEDQTEKFKGLLKLPGALETAAGTHGLLRATGGFEIRQMVGESRALRASIQSFGCWPAGA